ALTRSRRPDLWAARQSPTGIGQKGPKNTTDG
ncbi:MAG: tRNA (guanosine(37)-N1)-methyltransferase TrmD, partial [Bradyrhizobium sp.]|nr:tRNA (guanosine(37)-N1)-methyltransferase TrmD [Bradyrhizobium sp.]